MPTNLPPEYFEAERRFRESVSDREKIACLEELLGTIPKHKGTDKLRADYRRKLSKLKSEAEAKKKTGRHASAYHVEKEGPVRVVVVGAPNVGKSALVAAVTHAAPKVSEYEFTTWAPTPGMMLVRDIQIQLVDTPALSRQHVEPELFNLIRSADLLLLVVSVQSQILAELEESLGLLEEYRIVLCGKEGDVRPLDKGFASVPCIVLVNKVDDAAWDEEFGAFRELFENEWPLLPISVTACRNLEQMKEMVFQRLGIMRVYSKEPGKAPELHAPFVLKKGSSVMEFAARVHKDFVLHLKTARVWGEGVHDGQMVGRDHVLHDGDVVELHT